MKLTRNYVYIPFNNKAFKSSFYLDNFSRLGLNHDATLKIHENYFCENSKIVLSKMSSFLSQNKDKIKVYMLIDKNFE